MTINKSQEFIEKSSLVVLALFAAGVFFLVTEKYLAKAVSDISMTIAFIYYLLIKGYKYTWGQIFLETFIRITLCIFTAILVYGYIQQHNDSQLGAKLEGYSRMLIPVLLTPILIQANKLHKINISTVASLLLITSIIVLFTMSWDIYNGHTRVQRLHGHPIDYGNLCIMIGLLLLSLISYFPNYYTKILLLIMGILSIGASLYSQTRGGWITLFTVPWLLIYANNIKNKALYLSLSFFVVLIVFVTMYFTYPAMETRLSITFNNLVSYWDSEKSINKASAIHHRLLLWKIALQAFMENPIGGIGLGEYYAYKKDYILSLSENNTSLNFILAYKHEHSDYFTILARMGIIGLIAYIYMFYFLIKTFKQHLNSNNRSSKATSILGLSIILCYMDFGLTESFLHSNLGSYFFYTMITILLFILNKNTAKNH